MSNELDFETLARNLLSQVRDLLPRWLPGGRLVGHEWSCGSLRGENGDSLKVNINTGKWADFAGNEKGGDLISLYAAIQGIGQGDAFRQLSDDHGMSFHAETVPAKPSETPEIGLSAPPAGTPAPDMTHRQYGPPTWVWCYRDGQGQPMFYIARYDTPDGKQIVPWSWLTTGRWVAKGWPAPRPLYGLDLLIQRPTAPVLIVEGEKAADAARKIAGDHYTVITWPNGGKAVSKADWTPIYGRKVLIWPDADEAGAAAARAIAQVLQPSTVHPNCPEVKIIDITDGVGRADITLAQGWDAADALAEGWTWEQFKTWAKARVKVYDIPMTAHEVIANGRGLHDKPESVIAIQVNTEDSPGKLSESQWALMERLGLALAGNGTPICNITNALRCLSGIPEYADLVWFDEFHKRYFTKWRTGTMREWSDIDDLNLTQDLQSSIGLHRMSDDTVAKAVRMYAHAHTKNEPRDWMDMLAWDGEDRIAEFLTACLGVDPSDYARAASRNFWIGMVARIYRPGCQLDNMLVLQGAQGIGKTRALRLIAGDWYTSAKESVNRNDFFMILHGKLLVEIAELDSFGKAEVTRIKQVVSDPMDRYRAPYDRRPQDHARMSIFVGTTNEDTFLRDNTGARRFWPVRCGEVSYELIAKFRTQFFAEAVHRLRAGETWYQMPLADTLREQESRRQSDEWEYIINSFLNHPGRSLLNEITVTELAAECLKIEPAKLDRATQMRIANTLRAIGWTHRRKMVHGRQSWMWVKNDGVPVQEDGEF